MLKYFECVKCKKKIKPTKYILTCNHNIYYDYLDCIYEGNEQSDFLPVKNPAITMGEGNTPLLKLKNFSKLLGIKNLYAKDEGKNPTGCFKDRESFVLINKAIEFGFKEVFVISSGNAALSIAAYANKVGIKCICYIPKKTSETKKELIKLFNGKIKEIDGNYEEVYRKVLDSKQKGWNCTLNPYKSEGSKSIAYEIFNVIGVPDKVIVPCGNGSNLFGIWKGFLEIKALKKTDKMPAMIGVQIEHADPLKMALEYGKDFEILNNIPDSVAEGIVASESYSSPKAIKAIKDSKGAIITVTDNEIKNAMNEIVKSESLIMEPTSATVFAALKKLDFSPNEEIVVIITANGFKNLQSLHENMY